MIPADDNASGLERLAPFFLQVSAEALGGLTQSDRQKAPVMWLGAAWSCDFTSGFFPCVPIIEHIKYTADSVHGWKKRYAKNVKRKQGEK